MKTTATNWPTAFARYQQVTSRAKAISDARYSRKWHVALYYARKAGCDSLNTCRNWGTDLPGDAGAFARKALDFYEQALEHGRLYYRVCHLAHNRYMVPAGAAPSHSTI